MQPDVSAAIALMERPHVAIARIVSRSTIKRFRPRWLVRPWGFNCLDEASRGKLLLHFSASLPCPIRFDLRLTRPQRKLPRNVMHRLVFSKLNVVLVLILFYAIFRLLVIRPVLDRIAANHHQDDKAHHTENSRSYRQSFPPRLDQDTTKRTRS
jgi:hypothetical protein